VPWFGRRHEWAPPEPSCAFVVRAVALELPSIDDVVRPDGAGGAFPGVPQSKTRDESAVRRPLEPGDELSILSPDEAVVDVAIAEAEALRMPDEIRELMGLDAEMVHRVERARFELGLQLREPGRSVPEAVVYATDLAHRIAEATTGVVQDIHSFRTLPPTSRPREEPAEVDVRDHVVIHAVPEKGGSTAWLHTHGLVKFGRPEVEVYAVPADRTEHVAAGLNDIGQYFVQGALIRPGETLGDPAAPILAREGRRERGHWGKTPVLELVDVDDRGRPAKAGAMWGMEAWFALADQRPPK
jgi:hypothetical protein